MEPTVWKFITRHSLRSQLLLLLTLVSFPFLYLSLELPKISSTTRSTARGSRATSSGWSSSRFRT